MGTAHARTARWTELMRAAPPDPSISQEPNLSLKTGAFVGAIRA